MPKETINFDEEVTPPSIETQNNLLSFEVLYNSAKNKEVDSFDLVFDKEKNRVEVLGFHKPRRKKYKLDNFIIPTGSNKLILDLTRERSNEILHLEINLGNSELEEVNYFSGTYVGTSFTTNKTIPGTIYLLRRSFISNSYDEPRERCRLKLVRKLNLESPRKGVDVLNLLNGRKSEQDEKSPEEILEEYVGVYLACTREKRKKGEGNFMRVAIFTLTEEFTGAYRLPEMNARDSYRCYIGFSESSMEDLPTISLKLSFRPPNDPFMHAFVRLPRENDNGDKNKLKAHFSSQKDAGGLILYRVEEGAPVKPKIVNMDKNNIAEFDEIWGMLEVLNSPYLEETAPDL